MPNVYANAGGQPANLSNAQAGNGVSTNTAQRRTDQNQSRPALLRLITAIGATPTCSYTFEMSLDNASWLPMLYQDISTAGPLPAVTSAPIAAITTATTKWLLVPVDIPWAFVRCTYSANTNVTNTLDLWAF